MGHEVRELLITKLLNHSAFLGDWREKREGRDLQNRERGKDGVRDLRREGARQAGI